MAVGPAAARLGWPGSGWWPAMSTTVGRLPEVGVWRSKLAQAVLGQQRVDLVVVVGGGWQWARSTVRGAGCAQGLPVEVAGGDHAVWSLCEVWGRVGWPLSHWAAL